MIMAELIFRQVKPIFSIFMRRTEKMSSRKQQQGNIVASRIFVNKIKIIMKYEEQINT
jgi:hypothetical protein